MPTSFDLGPAPLPGALQGRMSLVFDETRGMPSLNVSCVEGAWVGPYADLRGFDDFSEPLADWEIYVCAKPHNRPVASAIFGCGLFDLAGRCSSGESDTYIWRLRPNLLDPEVRSELAHQAGWLHVPASNPVRRRCNEAERLRPAVA